MLIVQVLLIVAALYHLALVVLILFRTRTYRTGRNFAWYLLWIAAWMVCVASMQPQFGADYSLWMARSCFICSTLMGASWLWFCAGFPYVSREFRRTAIVLSLLGIPWLFLAYSPYMIVSVTLTHIPGSTSPWGSAWVDGNVGPMVLPHTIWLFACAAAGMLHLTEKARQVHGLARMQIRYILLGCVGMAAVGSLTNLILPALTGNTRTASYGTLSSLLVTTTVTLSILRYRLLEMNVVLRSGAVYAVTITLMSLLFALLGPVLDHALVVRLHLPPRTGIFLLTFFFALTFYPITSALNHLVNQRLYYSGVYDYRQSLREACNALAAARDLGQVTVTLTDAITRSFAPRRTAVFLPGHNDMLTRASVTGIWEALPHELAATEPVLAFAQRMDEVMLTEELVLRDEPDHSIGVWMEQHGMAAVAPCVAADKLQGLLLLGEKDSGEIYRHDDLEFLRILGKQAAIALNNVRHFDDVKLMNEYHARLLDIMQDGVVAIDPQQAVITFNRAAEQITGVPANAAVGKRLDEIGLAELDVPETGEQAVESAITTRTGAVIPVLATITPFNRNWETEQSRLIVFHDLSALRALQQAKMQAERFSSMGAMAASLAHEIKNPLAPIQTFAHLLSERYDDAEFRQEFSATVVHEVERINHLVSQMLDLVRKPATEREAVDLNEMIERLLTLIQPECEQQGVRVHAACAPGVPPIEGMANQLYQAVMNVLVNALQAMPDGGELTIALAVDDSQVVCRISDTGASVSADELSQIFEPLYSTRTTGQGLGLSLTYHFVRLHGGEVYAESRPTGGLTVSITLPITAADEVS